MGLREVLQARAAAQGRTAEVACGELGFVTVEALPLQEAEALARGADADRALFYAACRELQAEGDAMHRAGKAYAPDGIMRLVSDEEAAAAARVVLELSGVRKSEQIVKADELPSESEAVFAGENGAAEAASEGNDAPNAVTAGAPQEDMDEVPAAAMQKLEEAAFTEMPAVQNRDNAVIPQAEIEVCREEEAAVNEPFFAQTAESVSAGESAVLCLPQNTADTSAAETMRVIRKTETVERPAVKRQEVFADRLQESAAVCDAETVARQLLEGLRRAKWARGV